MQTPADINAVGIFNIGYAQRQAYQLAVCSNNKIPEFFSFLRCKNLLTASYIQRNHRRGAYSLCIHYKYAQDQLKIFHKIKYESRIGVTLNKIKIYVKLFGVTYFPLIILQTKKGFCDGYSAYKILVGGELVATLRK